MSSPISEESYSMLASSSTRSECFEKAKLGARQPRGPLPPLVGVEPAAQPVQLVVLADLVRALVQVAVQPDLVAVFREQVNLRRIFLDDPARHEKGQPQLAARELLDQPRDRDQR